MLYWMISTLPMVWSFFSVKVNCSFCSPAESFFDLFNHIPGDLLQFGYVLHQLSVIHVLVVGQNCIILLKKTYNNLVFIQTWEISWAGLWSWRDQFEERNLCVSHDLRNASWCRDMAWSWDIWSWQVWLKLLIIVNWSLVVWALKLQYT